jgi:hypothetical protein
LEFKHSTFDHVSEKARNRIVWNANFLVETVPSNHLPQEGWDARRISIPPESLQTLVTSLETDFRSSDHLSDGLRMLPSSRACPPLKGGTGFAQEVKKRGTASGTLGFLLGLFRSFLLFHGLAWFLLRVFFSVHALAHRFHSLSCKLGTSAA